MLRAHVCVLSFASLLGACATDQVELPLPSVHMLRPTAGRRDFTVRAGLGVAQGPEVQGMTDAVHGPDGEVDNTIPDYQNDSGGFFSHGDYTSELAADVGINFLKRFDVGWSSSRGFFAFANVFDSDHFTFTLSPAWYEASQTSRGRASSLEDGDKKFSASVRDQSLTALGSVLLGSRDFIGLSLYCGYGLHRIALSVEDHRTGETSSNKEEGKTRLIGIGADSKFVSVFLEQAWTALPQRDGSVPNARSFAMGVNVQVGGP